MEVENTALICGYCGYCGSEIAWKKTWKGVWKRKGNVHINICQEPPITFFCNRDCKLNWIFKRPGLRHEKEVNGNWIQEEIQSIFDMAVIDDKTDELEKYLKDNNLRIIREA